MVEGTPSRPYGGYAADLCRVERNMRLRRRRLLAELDDDEICPTCDVPGLWRGRLRDGVCDLAPNGPAATVKIKFSRPSMAWITNSPADVHAGRAVGLRAGRHPPHPRFATLTKI